MANNAHDFEFKNISESGTIKLSDFEGKIVLIVNTASKCGFTKQYGALQELYNKYKDRGLVVFAIPSNDFFKQEPGTNQDIINFTKENYGVDFPMSGKVKVRGKEADPFFLWLKSEHNVKPSWNFNKYLIGKNGEFLGHFGSRTEPLSEELVSIIEQNL